MQELAERVRFDLSREYWDRISNAVRPKANTEETIAVAQSMHMAYRKLYLNKKNLMTRYSNEELVA